LGEGPAEDQATDEAPDTLDSLVAAMQRGSVCHELPGLDANAVLRSVVDCMDFLAEDIKDELFDKLIERERLASTGIGNGIAIPHPRDPLSLPPERPVISTCFMAQPVNFNAIDDQPVLVFFVLISPTVRQHLHLLSRLSYCIRDREFVAFLRTHPAAQELFAQVAGFEKQLDSV
jgi:PTS system nitrogen regulatory IIA component